jgi:hypothetical protein
MARSTAQPGKHASKLKLFSKLQLFRGVQQCEVTYEEHVAITSLRFGHRSDRLFPDLIAMSGACCVWSMKISTIRDAIGQASAKKVTTKHTCN